MTAASFASLLNARRVGRGKWSALCPAHGDRTRSLAIAEGKKRPIIFKCMSQGCSPESILEAMGMTWQDILGDRVLTPEIKQRIYQQDHLKRLEGRWLACSMNIVWDSRNRHYWEVAARKTDEEIAALRRKMDPPTREDKMKDAIAQHGLEEIWKLFLMTEKGQKVVQLWSI